MHIYDAYGDLERRQATATGFPATGSDSDNGVDIPTYVWVTIVIFVAVAVTCGICARRNYRRQMLFHQQVMSGTNRPPPFLPFSRVYRPGVFGETDAAGGTVLRPPRARRRPSQASVTSLPVYMEQPGAQEIVLQRTGPKAEEDAEPQPPRVADVAAPPDAPPSFPEPRPSLPNYPSGPNAQSSEVPPPALDRALSAPAPTAAPAPIGQPPAVAAAEDRGEGVESNATERQGSERGPPPAFSATNPFRPGSR